MNVKMRHDNPLATGGPTTADVPEEAVKAYQEVGWYIDEQETKEKTLKEIPKPGLKTNTKKRPAGDE